MQKLWFLPIAAGLLLTGCATIPTGPSVMVLPGSGKDFEEFKYDDVVCRQWALQATGTTPNRVSNDAAISGAAIGTLVGAAGGAAIGAAAGNPAMGAAVGSGVGLVGGASAGADAARGARWSVQRRYDSAYMQCMYAKGNQVPMPAGYQRVATPPRPRRSAPPQMDVPPPPPGYPPPPPPGYSE